MGEKLTDRNVNQIILNGMPRSYESTVQTLTHLNESMTFEKLSTSLISESHRQEHRDQQFGDSEALAASFNKQASIQNSSTANQGRGGRWPQVYRGRGFPGRTFPRRSYYGQIRPPLICYDCGKIGHYARDYRAP